MKDFVASSHRAVLRDEMYIIEKFPIKLGIMDCLEKGRTDMGKDVIVADGMALQGVDNKAEIAEIYIVLTLI